MSTLLATLYDRADELLKIAPWEWMDEDSLIAFRHPALTEMAYLSVMGAIGEHRSVSVYLGDEALHRFNLIQETAYGEIELNSDDLMALILESRQLQVSFNGRGDLVKNDLEQIKSLGRKYRGKAWPQFRSMHPGRAAGPLSEVEIEVLTAAIAQILDVAPRLDVGSVEAERSNPQRQILGRELGPDHQWRDFWHDFDKRVYGFPTPDCEAKLAKEVSQQGAELDLQVAFKLIPAPVGPRVGEQTYPYVLLAVDSASGQVVGAKLLSTESSSYEELIAGVPNELLHMLKGAGVRPACLRIQSLRTVSLLVNLSKRLNVPISRERELPELTEAVESLQQVMMGGPR